MIYTEEHLRESFNVTQYGPVGFGHRQLKHAAEMAATMYGCEWAYRNPSSLESIKLKKKLRDLVISNTPSAHSNKDVVWQRFREYAIKFINGPLQ